MIEYQVSCFFISVLSIGENNATCQLYKNFAALSDERKFPKLIFKFFDLKTILDGTEEENEDEEKKIQKSVKDICHYR
jgi:hypothetical protein